MSRSQLNTLLDKYMDLNRCRQILEQRKASAAAQGASACGSAGAAADAAVRDGAGDEGAGAGSGWLGGGHEGVKAAGPPAATAGRDVGGMGMAVGKEFERIFGGLFRGKGAAGAGDVAGTSAAAQGQGPGGVQDRCV